MRCEDVVINQAGLGEAAEAAGRGDIAAARSSGATFSAMVGFAVGSHHVYQKSLSFTVTASGQSRRVLS